MEIPAYYTFPQELDVLVKHIHRILNKLPKESLPYYAFRIHSSYGDISDQIQILEANYPDARFYDIDGKKLFLIRDNNTINDKVLYLIAKE